MQTQTLRGADEDVSGTMAVMEPCLMLFRRHCQNLYDVVRVFVAFVPLDVGFTVGGRWSSVESVHYLDCNGTVLQWY